MHRLWDIFCRVIDNFGDAGVCWRLANQLAARHDCQVRLWIDDLDCLHAMVPAVSPALAIQVACGVEVHRWQEPFVFDRRGDVVIEAFACELPASYLAAMATGERHPVWINLEYLTAETWAEGCHCLASPHPTLPLAKHFFFPGFSPRTGGLLLATGDFRRPSPTLSGAPLEISLFCYDDAPVGGLLAGLQALDVDIRLHVAAGMPQAAVRGLLQGDGPWRCGRVEVIPLPFLSQAAYDALVFQCAFNFVRGEDSLVVALRSGKPFVWQAYRQDDLQARHDKVDAFLEHLTAGLDARTAAAAVDAFQAWNFGDEMVFLAAWHRLFAENKVYGEKVASWSASLAQSPDLASSLVSFCDSRL